MTRQNHIVAVAYHELRALSESLLDATAAEDRERITAALEQFLLSHCGLCGDILPRGMRFKQEHDWCPDCQLLLIPPRPSLPLPVQDDEVPF